MKKHLYKVTIEHLSDENGNSVSTAPISFETQNHDNIFRIIEILRNREEFTSKNVEQFAVGLKLVGEVIMENQKEPFFSELKSPFMDIMKIVKGRKV